MLSGRTTSSGGLDFNFSQRPASEHMEALTDLVNTNLSKNIFMVMYISHTLPGDPLINNLTTDQMNWYLMAYNQMKTDEAKATQEYYDGELGDIGSDSSSSAPQGHSGEHRQDVFGTDDNGMRYKAGNQADFGDDDYSWHDGDDIELVPDGLDKASIEAQLKKYSEKDQSEYLNSISGGDFMANSEYSEWQKKKLLDAKNDEAQSALKELQDKAQYLEETGQARPLVK